MRMIDPARCWLPVRRESRAVERRLRYRVKSTSSWLALMSAVVAKALHAADAAAECCVAKQS